MSASLVGSEMCIRDRACPLRPFSSPRRPCPVCRLAASDRPAHWSDNPVPVSYTHLTLPTICSV
eukprot:3148756-Alexandrium_andersonii.AAC.1